MAYGRILKKAVRQVPRLLPMNVHFSLLPDYRGAAPVSRAIADGKTRTGVTLQRIVAKLDAGPVIAMEAVDIAEDETTGELSARLADVGAALTVRTLARDRPRGVDGDAAGRFARHARADARERGWRHRLRRATRRPCTATSGR